MSVQTAGNILDFIAVPSATLFPILYAWASWRANPPFYKTFTGWAIITAKVGLAVLVDAAAAFRIWGPNYAFREYVVLIAFAIIVTGSWLYLLSFIRVQWRAHQARKEPR